MIIDIGIRISDFLLTISIRNTAFNIIKINLLYMILFKSIIIQIDKVIVENSNIKAIFLSDNSILVIFVFK